MTRASWRRESSCAFLKIDKMPPGITSIEVDVEKFVVGRTEPAGRYLTVTCRLFGGTVKSLFIPAVLAVLISGCATLQNGADPDNPPNTGQAPYGSQADDPTGPWPGVGIGVGIGRWGGRGGAGVGIGYGW
jgi:hypothetical protein